MIWNIVHQNTYADPLLSITRESMRLEDQPWLCSPLVWRSGYQYADVP